MVHGIALTAVKFQKLIFLVSALYSVELGKSNSGTEGTFEPVEAPRFLGH